MKEEPPSFMRVSVRERDILCLQSMAIGLLTVDEHLFLCYTFFMFDATFYASLACVTGPETWGRIAVQVCGYGCPQQAFGLAHIRWVQSEQYPALCSRHLRGESRIVLPFSNGIARIRCGGKRFRDCLAVSGKATLRFEAQPEETRRAQAGEVPQGPRRMKQTTACSARA